MHCLVELYWLIQFPTVCLQDLSKYVDGTDQIYWDSKNHKIWSVGSVGFDLLLLPCCLKIPKNCPNAHFFLLWHLIAPPPGCQSKKRLCQSLRFALKIIPPKFHSNLTKLKVTFSMKTNEQRRPPPSNVSFPSWPMGNCPNRPEKGKHLWNLGVCDTYK